jgi:tetratricopeptide (TPR) repeat protein
MRRPLLARAAITWLTFAVTSHAANSGSGQRAAAAGEIVPAAERVLEATGWREHRTRATDKNLGVDESTSAGRPSTLGPKIPDEMRADLRPMLDTRVATDLEHAKALRGEAIDLLERFIDEAPASSSDMPEALVRLGELEWEQAREDFTRRFQVWDKQPVDQRGPAPELDERGARALFGRVLRDYPSFDQTDLALYVDGFLAYEQGNEEEAVDRFERILRDYPTSRFTADAHMAKAESIFNGSYDYSAALAEYEKVLAFKDRIDPSLYGLALFKSAWCYWRLGHNEEATKRFVGVFAATEANAGPRPVGASERRQLDELQTEALKYVVQVFSEDEKNTAHDLYLFLSKIGGQRFSGKIVRALAQQFYDQAHYERGIEAYELLLELEPTSPEAGRWVLQIASGYDAVEDWPHVRATFEHAIVQYTTGGPWSRTQADTANVAATTASIERSLRDEATSLHAKAQHDKTSIAEFTGAAAMYDTYLSKFGREPKAYQVHFDLAEIDFFRLDHNLDAATHYMAAARAIPSREGNPTLATMRHDALYNALVALSRAMQSRAAVPNQTAASATGAVPVDAFARISDAYAEALDLYGQFYPRDPELPAMFYRQGRYDFDNGHYDAAVKIWGMLVEKFPSSAPARDAGDSILESFNRAQNYENIEIWARRLKALPAFGAPKAQERLDALIVVAVFKQGEQKAQAGDHAAAAAAYLHAAREFPGDSRAAQACVNAEQEAKAAGDVRMLREAAQLAMGARYAGRPESPVGAWIATTTFQAMGLFASAADVAESMTALGDRQHLNYEKFEHEKDAAYNAVVLREAIGEHARALADGAKFIATYSNAPEVDEVVFQMGRAQQDAGHPGDAADLYRRFLSRTKNVDHRLQGLVLLAQVSLKLGDEHRAESALDEAIRLGKQHGRDLDAGGRTAVAHARYMQGERVVASFDRIQIQGDVKQLKARLKQKTQLLKSAAKVFLDCVSFGVAEWTTAALYQIGRMYETFAKALRESPAPPEIHADDQRADYQSQVEEFAVPMEERSLDAYENGWKKAIDLGIYNEWTAKMREALGRLNTEIYPPFRETGFEIRSEGPMPMPELMDVPDRPGGAP